MPHTHTELLCFDVMPMGPLWWGQGDVPHGPHRAAVVTGTSQRAPSSFLPWPSSSCLSMWWPSPHCHGGMSYHCISLFHSFLFLNSSTFQLSKGNLSAQITFPGRSTSLTLQCYKPEPILQPRSIPSCGCGPTRGRAPPWAVLAAGCLRALSPAYKEQHGMEALHAYVCCVFTSNKTEQANIYFCLHCPEPNFPTTPDGRNLFFSCDGEFVVPSFQ